MNLFFLGYHLGFTKEAPITLMTGRIYLSLKFLKYLYFITIIFEGFCFKTIKTIRLYVFKNGVCMSTAKYILLVQNTKVYLKCILGIPCI